MGPCSAFVQRSAVGFLLVLVCLGIVCVSADSPVCARVFCRVSSPSSSPGDGGGRHRISRFRQPHPPTIINLSWGVAGPFLLLKKKPLTTKYVKEPNVWAVKLLVEIREFP